MLAVAAPRVVRHRAVLVRAHQGAGRLHYEHIRLCAPCVYVCVCVCVSVRERDVCVREREMCVCVREREMCVCERERCVCEREREMAQCLYEHIRVPDACVFGCKVKEFGRKVMGSG